jgi:hypothetical protein
MFGGHLMGLVPLLPYMVGLGLLMAGAAWMVDKSVAQAKIGRTWLFAVAFVYGVCGATLANQGLDLTPGRVFSTSVLRLDTSARGVRTLSLAPWDAAAVGYSGGILVSDFTYNDALLNRVVCVREHPGALGVRWFQLERCASGH